MWRMVRGVGGKGRKLMVIVFVGLRGLRLKRRLLSRSRYRIVQYLIPALHVFFITCLLKILLDESAPKIIHRGKITD